MDGWMDGLKGVHQEGPDVRNMQMGVISRGRCWVIDSTEVRNSRKEHHLSCVLCELFVQGLV